MPWGVPGAARGAVVVVIVIVVVVRCLTLALPSRTLFCRLNPRLCTFKQTIHTSVAASSTFLSPSFPLLSSPSFFPSPSLLSFPLLPVFPSSPSLSLSSPSFPLLPFFPSCSSVFALLLCFCSSALFLLFCSVFALLLCFCSSALFLLFCSVSALLLCFCSSALFLLFCSVFCSSSLFWMPGSPNGRKPRCPGVPGSARGRGVPGHFQEIFCSYAPHREPDLVEELDRANEAAEAEVDEKNPSPAQQRQLLRAHV